MKNSNRVIIGAVLIILGIAFLLDQLRVPLFGFASFIGLAWPVILVVIGIYLLSKSNLIAGWILLGLGVLFGLSQLFSFSVWATFWPILLIGLGVLLLYRKTTGTTDPAVSEKTESKDKIDETAIFSGIKRVIHSKSFHGGEVVVVFGGVELDLREVELPKEGATLNVTTIFGGTTITVSDKYRIESNGTPILGGWENKYRASTDATKPVLKIVGSVVFGGVEVKS